jgi:xanthine dehydrogenase accessory factor
MNRWATLASAISKSGPCVLASVVATKGSTPRDSDAWMIVTNNGFHGTIGGGTVEWRVMGEAQMMLQSGAQKRKLDYVLGPDLGQCCGGRMQVELEVYSKTNLPSIETLATESTSNVTTICIFGAGHVGRALVLALAPFPFAVKWVDPRPEAFPTAVPNNVVLHRLPDPRSILNGLEQGSFVYVMSHSHALDFEIVDAALRQHHLHVGVIGSATKRARFEKRLLEVGLTADRIAQLMCPIGVAGISSKHPAAIAASVVTQILQMDAVEASAVSQTLQDKQTA